MVSEIAAVEDDQEERVSTPRRVSTRPVPEAVQGSQGAETEAAQTPRSMATGSQAPSEVRSQLSQSASGAADSTVDFAGGLSSVGSGSNAADQIAFVENALESGAHLLQYTRESLEAFPPPSLTLLQVVSRPWLPSQEFRTDGVAAFLVQLLESVRKTLSCLESIIRSSERFDPAEVGRAQTLQQGMLRVERVITSRLEFASSCTNVMQICHSNGDNEMIDWLRESVVDGKLCQNQNAKYWWRCLVPESDALILFRNLDASYLLRTSANNEVTTLPRMVVDLRKTAAAFQEQQNEESRGALFKVLQFEPETGNLVPWYIKFQFLCIGFLELSFIGESSARRLFLEHGRLSKLNAKVDVDRKNALPQLLGDLLADAVNTLKLSDTAGKQDYAREYYAKHTHARSLSENETVLCIWLTDACHIESGVAKKRKQDPKSSSQDPSWRDPGWQDSSWHDSSWQGWHQNRAWSASGNRWG